MVLRKSEASKSDLSDILDFLDGDDLASNVWLIQDVCSMLKWQVDYASVLVCRAAGQISGVATVSGRPSTRFDRGYDARISSADLASGKSLIESFPKHIVGRIHVFSPMLQRYLKESSKCDCHFADLYFTASRESFCPTYAGDVVELDASDAALFEGCEYQPDWDYIGSDLRVLGIIRDGKAASSIGCGPVTPQLSSGRRVAAISGLHTETRHRRNGLARQLVSQATELLLRGGNIPCYWTEPENVASQALCRSLGYYEYAREMLCTLRVR